MQKNTCIVFIHSINEFHLSKNYATQTLCSRSIIQSLIASNRSTTYSSDIYLVSLGNLAHFCLVIWRIIIISFDNFSFAAYILLLPQTSDTFSDTPLPPHPAFFRPSEGLSRSCHHRRMKQRQAVRKSKHLRW